MRHFDTGATRDQNLDKIDFSGHLSPLAVEAFAAYMHRHRVQADGAVRSSRNWQKGIPTDAYMESMFRHFMEVWTLYEGWGEGAGGVKFREALCALWFNVQGLLHESLRQETAPQTLGTDRGPNYGAKPYTDDCDKPVVAQGDVNTWRQRQSNFDIPRDAWDGTSAWTSKAQVDAFYKATVK